METITFINKEHENFFFEKITLCRSQDIYHTALIYCLGINSDTRLHFNEIYNTQTGLINTECLQQGWITSGSSRVIRLAFNLYTNAAASINDYTTHDEQLNECRKYNVEDIFCCDYASYFWQAIKLRYPEYCE